MTEFAPNAPRVNVNISQPTSLNRNKCELNQKSLIRCFIRYHRKLTLSARTMKLLTSMNLFLFLFTVMNVTAVSGEATFADPITVYSGPTTTVQWGDINEDGIEDLLIIEGGRHSGGINSRILAWFEGPDWTQHDIAPTIGPFTGDSDLVDVDGDGDLDVVVAVDSHSGQSSMDAVYWYENTGNYNQDWPQHVIEMDVPNAFHIGDLETGDVDGDGKLDVVVRHLSTFRFVVYFQNSADNWEARRLDTRHREGLAVADLDQNGRADIIGNGYILFAPLDARNGEWIEKAFEVDYYSASQSGLNNSTKAAIYDMDNDGKDDIIISSAEGQAVYLAWYKNPINSQTGQWSRHMIENPQGKNHQVQIADIDLDGDADVYGGFSFGDNGVYWWENVNGLATQWTRHEIVPNLGCYSCVASDFDQDGDVDFAGPQKYVGQVNLFENTTATNLLTITPNELNFDEAGGTQSINLTADVNWSINVQDDWVSITPDSGGGNAVLEVTVAAHTGIGNRQSISTLTGGGINRSIIINQTGIPDTQAPSIPTNLTANNTSHNQTQLSWNASTDDSGVVSGYHIYQDGQVINSAIVPETSYTVTGLTPETDYEFTVSASDPAGNQSARSDAVLMTTTAAPPGPQAWAYWPMDEVSGLVAMDSSGSHHGNLTNMDGSEWNDGIIGGALEFDGIDDFVSLGGINLPSNQFTISTWIYATDFTTHPEGRIISKASGSSANQHQWMLSTIQEGGEIRLRFRLNVDGTTHTLIANSGALSINEWIHVAASYDGTMRLYKDTLLVGEATHMGNITSNSDPVAIGNQPQGDRPFAGLIDELCIFSEALELTDLDDLYNSGNGGVCQQTVMQDDLIFTNGFEATNN